MTADTYEPPQRIVNGCGVLTRDVEVGRVDVLSRRGPFGLAVLEAYYATGPGSMPPREEQETELLDHIGVGHIEVMLQHGDGDESTELRSGL